MISFLNDAIACILATFTVYSFTYEKDFGYFGC